MEEEEVFLWVEVELILIKDNTELQERYGHEAVNDDSNKVYQMLYDRRKNKEPKKDRSTLEVEYEKQ